MTWHCNKITNAVEIIGVGLIPHTFDYPMNMLTTSTPLLNIMWIAIGLRKRCIVEQWKQGIIDMIETRAIACPDKNIGRPCKEKL